MLGEGNDNCVMMQATRVLGKGTMQLPLLGLNDANAALNIEFFDTQRHMRVRVWPFNIDIVQRFTGMCQGCCMCQPLRDLHVSCCCVQELGRDCQSGGNGHLTA